MTTHDDEIKSVEVQESPAPADSLSTHGGFSEAWRQVDTVTATEWFPEFQIIDDWRRWWAHNITGAYILNAMRVASDVSRQLTELEFQINRQGVSMAEAAKHAQAICKKATVEELRPNAILIPNPLWPPEGAGEKFMRYRLGAYHLAVGLAGIFPGTGTGLSEFAGASRMPADGE